MPQNKFLFSFCSFSGKCPKINFYFHFVVFLRGELEKQVIIKVWPDIQFIETSTYALASIVIYLL
jgi:hypothetical protein